MWVTSLGLAGEAGIFASLPFYPMFSGVPNGPLRLSPPQVHAAVHNSGDNAIIPLLIHLRRSASGFLLLARIFQLPVVALNIYGENVSATENKQPSGYRVYPIPLLSKLALSKADLNSTLRPVR